MMIKVIPYCWLQSYLIEHITGDVLIFTQQIAPVVQNINQLILQSFRPDNIKQKSSQDLYS